MVNIWVFLQLALMLVFILAGLSKAKRLPRFEENLREFGVARKMTRGVAVIIIFIELSIAILLLAPGAAAIGAMAALFLLVILTAVVAYQLALGRRPSCNCLGSIASAPIGKGTIYRNLALMLFAIAIVVHRYPPRYLDGVLPEGKLSLSVFNSVLTPLLLQLIVGAALVAWMFKLFHQQGRVLLRLDKLEHRLGLGNVGASGTGLIARGLDVGSVAPGFSASTIDGVEVALVQLFLSEKPILLVFTDPQCKPCLSIAPKLVQWRIKTIDAIIVIVSRGDVAENIANFGNGGFGAVFVQREREIAELYRAVATPSAVRVSARGLVDSPLATGEQAIEALVRETSVIFPEIRQAVLNEELTEHSAD